MKLKLSNIVAFVASLAIALVLWLNVQPLSQPGKERELQVKLETRDLPANMIVVQPPESVIVFATGSSEDLDRLDSREVQAFINLESARVGVEDYEVQVTGPLGRRIQLRARRPQLRLDIERVARDERQVTLSLSGVPPAEYVYDGATMVPSQVAISGPESAIARVASVRVLLDLSRVGPNSDFTLPTEVFDAEGKPIPLVECEPTTVKVIPAVASAPASRRVVINPVLTGVPALGYKVIGYEIKPNQLELMGNSRELGSVSAVDTRPISIEGVAETVTRKIQVVLPEGLRVKGTNEVSVTIRIGRIEPPPGG
jgi:YbbR domain-containing protein